MWRQKSEEKKGNIKGTKENKMKGTEERRKEKRQKQKTKRDGKGRETGTHTHTPLRHHNTKQAAVVQPRAHQ